MPEPDARSHDLLPRTARSSVARPRAAAVLAAAALLALPGVQCPRDETEPPDGPGLRAAACRRDITPVVGVNHSDPIYLAGFGNNRPATGVRDPVWARGVVLENDGQKLALVVLDLVGYFYNEVQTIRSLVDPGRGFTSITVTSTHNHEGPDTMGLWGPNETTSGVDLGYLDFVNDSVVACIEEADDALEDAAILFSTGDTRNLSLPPWPDLVADGRVLQALTVDATELGLGVIEVDGDDGPVTNPRLPAFQVRTRGEGGALGEVLATLVNFASHPEALGSGNTLVTSDFPHAMRAALEERFGGVAIYLSADLGVLQGPLDVDMLDRKTGELFPRRTFEFADEMGRRLAARAAHVLDKPGGFDAEPKIEVATRSLLVEVENPFFLALSSLGVFGRRGFVTEDGVSFLETEAQVIRIGDAKLAITPNELDPQIGDLYRAQMRDVKHRFIAGLGNDEIGYQMEANKFNPSCALCFLDVFLGTEENCPVFETLDCDTVFINNIGTKADGQLQSAFAEMFDELAVGPH
ncbi:MAG: hypothetical protein MJE66_09710 [Proteobacteria bacterium]|nr:hypothetical protein [Pseudomonadota bacterium]